MSAIDVTPAVTRHRHSSRLRLYVRRFMRNGPAVGGLVIFGLLVLLAVVGPRLVPWTYYDIDWDALGAPPSATHWFGTAQVGTDMFAMVVHGLGRSLIIALSVSAISLFVGAFLGALAAYLGGRAETVIIWFVNFLLACPPLLLMCIIATRMSHAWAMLIVVLAMFNWMVMARVIWQLSTSIREREFVVAARFMGVRSVSVVFRHIVPNIGSLLVVEFTVGIVSAVMMETALSFLGFGIQLPDVSLGSLLTAGQSLLLTTPWGFWFPSAALLLLTLSVGFMSDGLRDALDPNSAAGGKA